MKLSDRDLTEETESLISDIEMNNNFRSLLLMFRTLSHLSDTDEC
jgi:hypothetical protein